MSKTHHGGGVEEIAEKLSVPMEKIKDFSANINPLGFLLDLWSVLVRLFANIEVCPNPKHPELRKAIAQHLGINSDDVLVENSTTEILDETIRAEKATDALVLAPTFGEYERLLKRIEVKTYHYYLQEEDNFALEVDELIDLLKTRHEMTVICLTSPNNPTGQMISLKDLRKLANFYNKRHQLLILNESFISLAIDKQPSFVNELMDQGRVYIIRAVAKSFVVPGLRLDYGITKNARLKALLEVQENTWSVNGIADVFGQNMFRAREYIELTRQWLGAQQPALHDALKKVPVMKVFPSTTNFFLFKCTEPDLRKELIR